MFYLSQSEYFLKYPIEHVPYWYPLTYYDLGFNPSCLPQCTQYVADSVAKRKEEGKTMKHNQYLESLRVAKDSSKRYLYNLIKNYYNGKECNETLEAFAQSWKE